jgi:hypothetical protein
MRGCYFQFLGAATRGKRFWQENLIVPSDQIWSRIWFLEHILCRFQLL